MADPTPELEAAARAIAQIYDLGQGDSRAWMFITHARAALAAVLKEPSEGLINGVAADLLLSQDASKLVALAVLRAAGRHILGDET